MMNGISNRRIKSSEKKIGYANRCLCVLIFVAILGIVITYVADSNDTVKHYLENMGILFSFSDQDSTIMDTFSLIWGISLTIVLFLFETGNQYSYGITLKNIVNFSFKRPTLVLGLLLYFVLCPLAYIFESNKCYLACIWCVLCVFCGVLTILLFIVSKTRTVSIKKQIKEATRNQLQKEYEKQKDSGYTFSRSKADSMAITMMIEHLDYSDASAIDTMQDVVADLLTDEIVIDAMSSTAFEHILVMVWVNRIIERSGIERSFERRRTMDILLRLWDKISRKIEEKYVERSLEIPPPLRCWDNINLKKEKKLTSIQKYQKRICKVIRKDQLCIMYAVEVLIPLLERGDSNGQKVFENVWIGMSECRREVVPYLLLYLEYNHCFYSKSSEYYKIAESYNIQNTLFTLYQGHFSWDAKLGLSFWLGWNEYDEINGTVGLREFNMFREDLQRLRDGSQKQFKTFTLQYLCWKGGFR